mgnify:CR=1 FL=1
MRIQASGKGLQFEIKITAIDEDVSSFQVQYEYKTAVPAEAERAVGLTKI